MGALTTRYAEVIEEPLNAPLMWPTYQLNRQVTVRSGNCVPRTGIYLPDVDHGFPALLVKSDDPWLGEAFEAMIDWTLVERVAAESDVLAAPSLIAPIRLRIEGGKACPQTGYWFTPAQVNSRSRFTEADLMPAVGSDFGSTIWQWDPDQSA